MKRIIIPTAVILGLTTFAINEYKDYQNEQLIDRIRKSEYNPQTMLEVKLEEKRNKKKWIKRFKNK